MSKYKKDDPLFFSKISKLRKNKVGGQAFKKDPELAKKAGKKGGKVKKVRLDERIMTEYLDDIEI